MQNNIYTHQFDANSSIVDLEEYIEIAHQTNRWLVLLSLWLQIKSRACDCMRG